MYATMTWYIVLLYAEKYIAYICFVWWHIQCTCNLTMSTYEIFLSHMFHIKSRMLTQMSCMWTIFFAFRSRSMPPYIDIAQNRLQYNFEFRIPAIVFHYIYLFDLSIYAWSVNVCVWNLLLSNMNAFLQQTCLLKEDQRCRSLEDLYTVETESKEMREIVRINSIRKTKSVDDILREQLEEVKDVMHKNIIKIRDREGKLDDLLNRGDVLTGSVSICLLVVSVLKFNITCFYFYGQVSKSWLSLYQNYTSVCSESTQYRWTHWVLYVGFACSLGEPVYQYTVQTRQYLRLYLITPCRDPS